MGTVDELIFTWVSTRALPAQFLHGAGHPSVSRQIGYLRTFTAGGNASWHKPWTAEKSYNFFWAYNLGQNYPQASADRAWRRQVPLVEAAPPDLTTGLAGVNLVGSRYIYPTGIGVAVTAQISGAYPSADLLMLLSQLEGDPVVDLAASTNPKAMKAILDDLLNEAVQGLLGQPDPDVVADLHPSTIATVAGLTGWPATPPAQADDVHRLLEGLCRRSPTPLNGTVGPLTDALLDPADMNPETVRVQIANGRAIWSPEQATTPAGARRLACYHRNLVLATMQAAVMLNTVQAVAGQPTAGLSADVQAVLRPVVNVLGLLYTKVNDVYASELVRRQISSSGLWPTINNTLRVSLGVGSPLG